MLWFTNKFDLIVINRSFLPHYPIIGEGLLRLAESLVPEKKVGIITQNKENLKKYLNKNERGKGVCFFLARSFSKSYSTGLAIIQSPFVKL